MGTIDIEIRDTVWEYLLLIVPGLMVFYIVVEKKYKAVRDHFFSNSLHAKYKVYLERLEPIKAELFADLKELESNVTDLKNRGLIRILEIGIGTGTNLKYYPQQTRLIVVDPNIHFKQYFLENFKKFPDIFLEKFIVSWSGEELLAVKSASVDIVVATTVLCSVPNVRRYLNEIRRVLAKGGRFHFVEHVPSTQIHSRLYKFQKFLTWSQIWPTLFDCHLDRKLLSEIQRSGFSNVDYKYVQIDDSIEKNGRKTGESRLLKLIQNHIVGIATK